MYTHDDVKKTDVVVRSREMIWTMPTRFFSIKSVGIPAHAVLWLQTSRKNMLAVESDRVCSPQRY